MHARFFTKLEQGSKASDKGRKWYRGVKELRRTDGVLRYLQHARNSDEHTINASSQIDLQRMLPTSKLDQSQIKVYDVDHEAFGNDDMLIAHNAGPEILTFSFPRLAALAVIDRGERYDPPNENSGEGKRDVLIEDLAFDGLKIIETVLEEAKSLG